MGKFNFFEGVIQGNKVRIEHQFKIARCRKLKALFERSRESQEKKKKKLAKLKALFERSRSKNKEDREVGEEEKKKKIAKLKALSERIQSQMQLQRFAILWCRWQKWHSQVTVAKVAQPGHSQVLGRRRIFLCRTSGSLNGPA